MAKKPTGGRNRQNQQKSSPPDLGADDQIQGSVTPGQARPAMAATEPTKQPETTGKQPANKAAADQTKFVPDADDRPATSDQRCPKCSNDRRTRMPAEKLQIVMCETVPRGLSWIFKCPKCNFEVQGPTNIRVEKQFLKQIARQHEQHNVRENQ